MFVNSISVEPYLTGTTRPKLNKAMLLKIKIPFPPIEEQGKISDMFTGIEQEIVAETQRKSALEALFNSLLHHLITGKVRVL